jgi:hypothetical protein
MRKLLIIHAQHHPKADIDPLKVPTKQGRRGMMQLEEAYTVEITKLVEYIDSKEDPLIQPVKMHQHIINSAELQTDSSTERKRTNKGQHSRENKRNMAREAGAWIIGT